MYKILFVILIFSFVNVFAQLKDAPKLDNADKIYSLKNDLSAGKKQSLKNENSSVTQQSKKSSGLAFIYSLVIPGTGQLYANRFDVGKYFMISEASLWLGFAAFTIYGNWLLDDAYNYASLHAGINNDGKERDDPFYIDIANYESYEQFNNEQLIFGNYENLYDPAKGYYFYWDNNDNRRKYRDDKLAGDRTKNDRLFIVGAILVNHIVSAVSAIFVTNKYNEGLKKSSGGFVMNADVMKFNNRVDGIKLKLTKWF
jgi:hypothetical protein